jgi:hypothetical protein
MKLEPIVKDAAINFYDCVPQFKELMLDAFNHIAKYENVVDGVDAEDFEVLYASAEPTNDFFGAFITSIFGSYMMHDFREEQKVCDEDDATECNIFFYSLTKLSNDATN